MNTNNENQIGELRAENQSLRLDLREKCRQMAGIAMALGLDPQCGEAQILTAIGTQKDRLRAYRRRSRLAVMR